MEVFDELYLPAALPPEKEPPVHVGWEAQWTASRSERCEVDKHLMLLPGIEPRPSSPEPTTILTKLSRLSVLVIL
jgi:hypothetical protein